MNPSKRSLVNGIKYLLSFVLVTASLTAFAQGPPDGDDDTIDVLPDQLKILLYDSVAFSNDQDPVDEVLIIFEDDGNNGIDAEDEFNTSITNNDFSLNNNGVLLSTEIRNIPIDQEIIQLDISDYSFTTYTLVADGNNMPGPTPYLYDAYTSSYTEIPQDDSIEYSYTVDINDPATAASNRFSVVFSVTSLSANSYTLESLNLFPNPVTNNNVYINTPLRIEHLKVVIFNNLGQEIQKLTMTNVSGQTPLYFDSKLDNGIYFLQLASDSGTTVKRIIVNN